MDKPPKQVVIIAVLGVIIITGGAVVALAYNAIVHGGGTDGLTTIAAVGAGGLVSVLGGQAAKQQHPQIESAVASVVADSVGTGGGPAGTDRGDIPPLPEEPLGEEPDDGVEGHPEGLPYSPDNGPDLYVADPSDEAPKGEF